MAKFIPRLKALKTISYLLLLLPTWVLANLSIEHTPIPGGIALVDFQTNHANPKAFYGKVRLYVQKTKPEHWQALVGIPLLATPGEQYIQVKDFSQRKIPFSVEPHQYQEQHITLKGKQKKYVNPNLAHMDRIKRERPILSNARQHYSQRALATGAFSLPVSGITTGSFGLKRFYNQQARNPHTGVDYAAKTDTPIRAPAKGRVILTGEFYFNGKTVFIDHGMGLVSVYIHMNNIQVEQGQLLNAGDIIGGIGQTGRATGPHLHWGVYLNQTAVNPNLLLEQ